MKCGKMLCHTCAAPIIFEIGEDAQRCLNPNPNHKLQVMKWEKMHCDTCAAPKLVKFIGRPQDFRLTDTSNRGLAMLPGIGCMKYICLLRMYHICRWKLKDFRSSSRSSLTYFEVHTTCNARCICGTFKARDMCNVFKARYLCFTFKARYMCNVFKARYICGILKARYMCDVFKARYICVMYLRLAIYVVHEMLAIYVVYLRLAIDVVYLRLAMNIDYLRLAVRVVVKWKLIHHLRLDSRSRYVLVSLYT